MKNELIVHEQPKSPISEIFKILRTNIQFVAQGKNKIKGYMSPSIPQLMKNERSVFRATLEAQATFEKRLEHELFQQWGLIP